MKPVYIVSWLFALAISFVSCDDWLDKTPKDRLYPDVYFKTEDELRLFTNQFYNNLVPSAVDIYSESSDLIVKSDLMLEMSGQRIIPDEGNGWNFTALRDINFYLQYSHNCTEVNARNRYDGVARFFRAYFYFEKVKRYGDIPWYDKALDSDDPELYKARDSREFVMQKMLEDLDFAIANLPKTKNAYVLTRWTALALKSRVCLFEGTFRKYHGLEDYEKYLNACVSASETFMNESGYTLYKSGSTPYRDLFASINLQADEVIFGRDYEASLSVLHNVQNYENSTTMGRPGMQSGETTVNIPLSMKLHARKYQLAVWADYVEKPEEETYQTFYDATDMAFILRATPYKGNSRYHDAFYGNTPLDLSAYRDQWNVTVPVDVKMLRPMASYNLIATDVAKFLKKVTDKEITGKRFTMTVKYNYYLPTGFDVFTGRLKNSLQYIEYNKTVDLATLQKEENKEEFNIGFDYLLINNESVSSIPVTIEITNESKTVVARYQNLKIPYQRNKETNIRGYFLTASPGISFDPDFNDEDIIIDVTPIVKNN